MKKVLISLLAIITLVSTLFAFSACKKTDSIVIAVPDGGPALGMAYLMKNCKEIEGAKVTYKIVDGSNGIKAAVLSGEADIALMPTNMASILYNGGIDIKLVGTNSYGLLYLLSKDDASTFNVSNLVGKVLYNVGKGGTPDVVVKKILQENSIAYRESDTAVNGEVALCYADAQTIIAKIKQGVANYAVLGEPVVSNALTAVSGLNIVLDLQAEWGKVTNTLGGYPQTALIAKGSLINKNPKLVKKIAELTGTGANYLAQNANELLLTLKEAGASVPPALTSEGVQRANIKPKFATEAKTDVVAYLTILKTFAPALIGGALPNDDFYSNVTEK